MTTSKFFRGVRGFAIAGLGRKARRSFILLVIVTMFSTSVAEAGWSAITKWKPRWGNTKYIAKTHAGCGALLLCLQSQHAWNSNASASCSQNCFIGRANSSCVNGPGGAWGSTDTRGLGWAGLSGEGTDSSAAENQARYRTTVDEESGLVVVTFIEGILAAADDGSFSELEITVARLRPGTEGESEGPGRAFNPEEESGDLEAEEIPLESVLWNGMIRVANGDVEYPERFESRRSRGLTERRTEDGFVLKQVNLNDLRLEVPFDNSERGEIVVVIRGDSGGGEAEEVTEEPNAFLRGDANADGVVDLADPVSLLGELFSGASRPSTCAEAGDANGDGGKDVADAVYLLVWSFSGGAAPVAPGPEVCGSSPGGEVLGCEEYNACP